MLSVGTISKEMYEEKMVDFTRKRHKLSERIALLEDSMCTQKDISRRRSELRDTREQEQVPDEFDMLRQFAYCPNYKLSILPNILAAVNE